MAAPSKQAKLLERFASVRQWEGAGKRAPHKPLLLLLGLARVQRGEPRTVAFAAIEETLGHLLQEFGPPWPTTPLYPFWYLQTDGLWEIPGRDKLEQRAGKLQPKVTALRALGHGGFPNPIDKLLRSDAQLLRDAALLLLNRHFESSLHSGIAAACGLDLADGERPPAKKKRDRAFREKVLTAYEFRCAACGWNVFLGRDALALEAAHLFWHTLGGPDDLDNGLCLCSLHHLALDRGAISIDGEGVILVSQHVNGGAGVNTGMRALVGTALRQPLPGSPGPNPQHANWHREQVFRGPALAVA